MPITLYHNPRCTKSRQALSLLEARGTAVTIIEYLKTPPDEAELKRLLNLLGMKPHELLRKKEPEYHATSLDRPGVTEAEVLRAMVSHPKLIERPIAVSEDHAVLGRPPENVLAIL